MIADEDERGSDVVLFRMKHTPEKYNGVVVPPKGTKLFEFQRAGISYTFQRRLFAAGFQFSNSRVEDFQLLVGSFVSVSITRRVRTVSG